MIRSISSLNESGELFEVELGSSEQAGFPIITIEGLEPPAAIINSVSGPNYDGVRVNSTRATNRVITLTMGVAGSGAVEETRRLSLYRYFPIKKKVVFGVKTDTRDAVIEAFVESNELKMFNRIQHTVLTLQCPSSYFKSSEEQVVLFSGVDPAFEFPFSNESLVDPLISFGELLSIVENTIVYTGDAPTGAIFNLHALGAVEDISIHNNSHNQTIIIDTSVVSDIVGGPIQLGDDITIDTRVGHKSATLLRGGVTYNILNALSLYNKWLILQPGPNDLLYNAVSGIDLVRMSVKYDILYEGM